MKLIQEKKYNTKQDIFKRIDELNYMEYCLKNYDCEKFSGRLRDYLLNLDLKKFYDGYFLWSAIKDTGAMLTTGAFILLFIPKIMDTYLFVGPALVTLHLFAPQIYKFSVNKIDKGIFKLREKVFKNKLDMINKEKENLYLKIDEMGK